MKMKILSIRKKIKNNSKKKYKIRKNTQKGSGGCSSKSRYVVRNESIEMKEQKKKEAGDKLFESINNNFTRANDLLTKLENNSPKMTSKSYNLRLKQVEIIYGRIFQLRMLDVIQNDKVKLRIVLEGLISIKNRLKLLKKD